jgi:transposase
MTVTELSPNGHGSNEDRARQAWRSGMSGPELARRTGMKERTAGYWAKQLREEAGNPVAEPVGKPPPSAAGKPARRSASRRQRDPWKVAGAGIVLVVGLAVSYSHIVHLALLAGGGWWAWLMPLALDGLALVSLRHLAHERRYLVAWAGVAVGAIGSLTANVLAMDPSLADMRYVRWGFATLPPIAVVLCGHLLDRGDR